jgi:hypothetical protein
MVFEAVFERFIKQSPLTVMTRATMEHALDEAALDELFDRTAERQYTRTLLFSAVVQLMSLVVCNRISVHRAFKKNRDRIGVTLQAVYDKLDRLEASLSQMLVRHFAGRLAPVIEAMGGTVAEWLPGYRVKVMDGNHIAATDHRIGVLRDTAAGALPGFALVVLDPRLQMVVDVFPEEDGHAQERSLTNAVLATVGPKDVWIDDRNFCTIPLLFGIAQRDAFFVTRQHRTNAPWEPTGLVRQCGETETGTVIEQRGVLRGGERGDLKARRVTLRLGKTTRDGDRELHILTNLPATVSAVKIADLYRDRWTIETAFQEMERALGGEVATLGYPKAALFAFCVALVAYNVYATLKASLRAVHGEGKVRNEVSGFHIAADVALDHPGMNVAIPDEMWEPFQKMTAKQFGSWLVSTARNVDMRNIKKAKRGPKKVRPKPAFDPTHPHVSTARLLAARRARQSKRK